MIPALLGETYMRWLTAAILLLGALTWSEHVEALDCAIWALSSPSWWERTPDGSDAPTEQQQRDAESRAMLELLDRTPIVFRGRVASVRYLTNPHVTFSRLLAFDHVEVLKGRLMTSSPDQRAVVVQQRWCDRTCDVKSNAMEWRRGATVLVGAHANRSTGPTKVMDPDGKRVVYTGRVDAELEMCDSGRLQPIAFELLNASNDEINRLRREYRHRQFK
ncbi:hypothetical protein J6500_21175 [Bradyrhizobium sp. WSM 1704]|uniref:hypothetical protein n=1 Tax=Bradyrhizobium semiaridum TaxID=2821404 RepID=UPI001CE36CA8|nr:hypothetical protein [Bradyrhizobium semiaridum]MCA6124383.1 hypothetical protein [Bradyrhizobium semiaridum]